jgi:hypothetical protein
VFKAEVGKAEGMVVGWAVGGGVEGADVGREEGYLLG